MENNPIIVVCTVIGTLIAMATYYQSHTTQAGRGLIYGLGSLSLAFFLFAGYRWWEGNREYDLIALKQDFSDWEEAVKCGSTSCFQAYVQSHPNGKHVAMAQARLQSTTDSRKPVSSIPGATESSSAPHVSSNLISGRYQDNGDGTVTDVQTHLRWMHCALGQTWNGGMCTGEAARYTWQDAQNTAYGGWRVPSREELRSLVYCSSGQPKTWNDTGNACEGNYTRPTINSAAFPNTPESNFWSALPDAGDSGFAWGVYFSFGNDYWYGRSNAVHVRLVRAGQ